MPERLRVSLVHGNAILALAMLLLLPAARVSAATPAIAAQTDYALALSRDGQVFAWGWDARGQLARGRTLFSATPRKIAGLPTLAHMDAGAFHVAAVDTQGNVWTWGQDAAGQLGVRSIPDWTRPGRVTLIGNARRVVASWGYTAVLKNDGTVWIWGTAWGTYPRRIETPESIPGLTDIVQIRGGGDHLVALKSDGTVWTVGSNLQGQLGDGTSQGSQSPARQVAGLSGITRIAAGTCSSMALRGDGTVLAWGDAACGYASTPRYSPQVVSGLGGVADIAGGAHYSHAVTTGGEVYSWENAYQPVKREGFTQVATLEAELLDQTLALLQDGTVAAYGDNELGQHGLGTTAPVSGVRAVPGLSDVAFVSTASSGNGGLTHFALTRSGVLYGWGSNFEGQLAQGDSMLSSVPMHVQGLPSIVKVATGDLSAYALDATGRVWAWGDNVAAQLGDGTTSPRSTPVAVSGISGVIDVAAGRRFVLFLKGDGTVWRIGAPTAMDRDPTPKQVAGLSDIAALAARYMNAFAIRRDGKLFAWGAGIEGLNGDGTTQTRDTPVMIAAIDSAVTAVAPGPFHVLARTADGTVWSWGSGTSGLLGDGIGEIHNRLAPARIAGVSSAVGVAAGYSHSLVVLQDGSVLSWGERALGGGALDVRYSPGPVSGLPAVRAVAGADWTSFALADDGIVYAWGGGVTSVTQWLTFGASTGDGTFVYRRSPSIVLREGALGNLDTGDWFLDLDGTVASTPPASLVPRVLPVADASLTDRSITLAAAIHFRAGDYGKNVGTYVLGYVPAVFLDQVPLHASMTAPVVRHLKQSTTPILVQLTPSGWATVNGQLVAMTSGVINANGSASSILNSVNPGSIPGARFCIGYGESADAMLSAGALADVLSIEGTTATASGMPCVLSGIYVSGPPSSMSGSAVTFTASVVGVSPTGSVLLRDQGVALGGALALATRNQAVATASVTTAALAVGVHAIGASYSGDSQNPAMTTEVPLRHTVASATAGATVALSGPVSSTLGDPVTFIATVSGNNPTGTVQLKDGSTDVASPVSVFNGTAALSLSTLALGAHSLTAAYSGDTANTPSESSAWPHTVYAAITTSITLVSSAAVVAAGAPVTFTATVTGASPTGSVVFRDGYAALGSAALAAGIATLTAPALEAGQHVITAEYSGDANNAAVSSAAIFQQMTAAAGLLGLSAASLDFAGQSMNTTSPAQTVTLMNATAGATTVMAVTASTHFAVSHDCATLAVNASCMLSISFTPTAEGALSGMVTVTSTAGTNSVALTGTGERSLATHYYRSILRRAPDAAGKAFWELEAARLTGLGTSANEAWFAMAMSFYQSPEYLAFGRTPTEYLRDLYNTFFNRAADAGGLSYWSGLLSQGMPREVALASFMFSNEFSSFSRAIFGSATTRPEIDTVVDFYRGILGRLPETDGLRYWLGQLRIAQCQGASAVYARVEDISSAYIGSSEYLARNRTNAQFVGDLYNAFLRRGGDLDGVLFWIRQLDSNAQTRSQLRQAFIASPEFAARVGAMIDVGCQQ